MRRNDAKSLDARPRIHAPVGFFREPFESLLQRRGHHQLVDRTLGAPSAGAGVDPHLLLIGKDQRRAVRIPAADHHGLLDQRVRRETVLEGLGHHVLPRG